MKYTGITADTAKKFLLDSGAFFKNYDILTDTFETAVTAGKLLGATNGGGVLSIVPTIRKIEVDGARGDIKGHKVFEEWLATVSANVKEVSTDTIAMALGTTIITDGPTGYKKISLKDVIEDTDYIDNITWVGRLSGSLSPFITQFHNALSTGGLVLNVQDKGEAVIAMSFTAHAEYVDGDWKLPVDIYAPDATVV